MQRTALCAPKIGACLRFGICTIFSRRTEEDIQACLSYAADRERQLLVARA
jgi:hypothetical protein